MGDYLVLIYEDENGWAQADQQVFQEVMEGHNALHAKQGAKLKSGNALQSTSSATTIRSDGTGGFTVTDGPFVETKEALAGYYLIEAADLDEAITIAKDVPARFGGVEVRPIRVFD